MIFLSLVAYIMPSTNIDKTDHNINTNYKREFNAKHRILYQKHIGRRKFMGKKSQRLWDEERRNSRLVHRHGRPGSQAESNSEMSQGSMV